MITNVRIPGQTTFDEIVRVYNACPWQYVSLFVMISTHEPDRIRQSNRSRNVMSDDNDSHSLFIDVRSVFVLWVCGFLNQSTNSFLGQWVQTGCRLVHQ